MARRKKCHRRLKRKNYFFYKPGKAKKNRRHKAKKHHRKGKNPTRSAFTAKEWKELERWLGTKEGKRYKFPKIAGAFGRSFGNKRKKSHRRKRR